MGSGGGKGKGEEEDKGVGEKQPFEAIDRKESGERKGGGEKRVGKAKAAPKGDQWEGRNWGNVVDNSKEVKMGREGYTGHG